MKPSALLTSCGLLAAALAVAALPRAARAENPLDAVARLSDARLEQVFWDCERLAARIAVPLDTGAMCARAGDELRQRRFDGDFERMLAWWRSHKAAQHAQHSVAEPLLP